MSTSKQGTDLFQIIQRVILRLVKNASDFQGISANEFQIDEKISERRLDAYDCWLTIFIRNNN